MVAAGPVAAQTGPVDPWVPPLTSLVGPPASELRDVVARFDRAWLKQITAIDFDPLGLDGRLDHLLFRNLLTRDLAELRQDSLRAVEMAPALHESWQDLVRPDPAATAKTLDATKAFHDAILQSGHLPVKLVRAGLMKQPPQGDFEPSWRVAGF